jgi:hypothetical protein
MPTIKLVEDGTEIQVVDKTQPLAKHDYACAWSDPNGSEPHMIKQGQRYVRVVYKLRGHFESDHICLDCWCGPEEANDKATSS